MVRVHPFERGNPLVPVVPLEFILGERLHEDPLGGNVGHAAPVPHPRRHHRRRDTQNRTTSGRSYRARSKKCHLYAMSPWIRTNNLFDGHYVINIDSATRLDMRRKF